MDVFQHRGLLLSRSARWLHLYVYDCIQHRINCRKLSFVVDILFALLKVVVIVGHHRTTAFFLAWSALPRSRLLLPSWHLWAINSVCNAQEVQDELLQIPQLPGHLFGYELSSPP